MHSYTKSPPEMHLHTKFGISTSKNIKRCAPDTIILKTRSEVKVKVTVTRKWYVTLRHPRMHLHTKFGIPTSKNIGDIRAGPRRVVYGEHLKPQAWSDRRNPWAGGEYERGVEPPAHWTSPKFFKKSMSLRMHFKPFWCPFFHIL